VIFLKEHQMKLEPLLFDERTTPLSYKQEVFKEDADLIMLFPAIVYFAGYGRNAWYSTWVEYYEKFGFFSDIDECKSWIEGQRVQGSVWSITQLPALSLSLSTDTQLWISSVNLKEWWNADLFDKNDFLDIIKRRQFNTTVLRRTLKCYFDSKLLAFKSNKTADFDRLKYRKKCLSWKAISQGGYYHLDWSSPLEITHDYRNLICFINSFKKIQQQIYHGHCFFSVRQKCSGSCEYWHYVQKQCTYTN
jgi:hypothetical protein